MQELRHTAAYILGAEFNHQGNMKISVLKRITGDPVKTARAVGLIYVSDSVPGIRRKKAGKGFCYLQPDGSLLKEKEHIQRIRRLVLPPAWDKVWICIDENGHLQATGFDTLKRKQYRYHPEWNKVRNETKYYRMLRFGEMLPEIRRHIEKDIDSPGLTQRKVLALVVSVMERTYIRIGNSAYEKLYGSYGLTTLRDKHVKTEGDSLKFCFKGKKGVYHEIALENRKLARLVKKCKDIPGQELFQYFEADGSRRPIDSGDINKYLEEITGGCDFTAKDFRTWAGTVNILKAFREIGPHGSQTEANKNIVKALDMVSKKLGNTRTVCKKYYVHPAIISAYQDGVLTHYLQELDVIEENDGVADLASEEKLVMKLLQTIKVNEEVAAG
jgi:DNA topoisomerase-1